MSIGTLVFIGLGIELAMAGYVLIATQVERNQLADFVQRAQRNMTEAIKGLREPYQSIVHPIGEQLALQKDLDGVLVEAVVDTARHPFKSPLAVRLTGAALCAACFLAPASYGLLNAARDIVRAWNGTMGMQRAQVYLSSQRDLEGPFAELRDSFQGSAVLFFGLAFVWALSWYLRRPAAREARFVRAILEAVSKAKPGTTAPVGGRLAELIAPDRGLGRPVTAMMLCVSGITAGWLVLYQMAEVRAANDLDPVYDVWPDNRRSPAKPPAGLELPRGKAGAWLEELPPSVTISLSDVNLAGGPLTRIVDGGLPEEWQSQVPSGLSVAGANGRLLVLADNDIRLTVLLELFEFIGVTFDIHTFELLIRRSILDRPAQSFFPVELAPSRREAAVTIELFERGLRIPPDPRIHHYDGRLWPESVRNAVRSQTGLIEGAANQVVEIVASSESVPYHRLIQVLSAADTTCDKPKDCGLPGLGLLFRMTK